MENGFFYKEFTNNDTFFGFEVFDLLNTFAKSKEKAFVSFLKGQKEADNPILLANFAKKYHKQFLKFVFNKAKNNIFAEAESVLNDKTQDFENDFKEYKGGCFF